jgi:hypothetical protein
MNVNAAANVVIAISMKSFVRLRMNPSKNAAAMQAIFAIFAELAR